MKLSDKITIVVPCKNEEDYISHLLDSFRSQDIGDTRIIIADCSTDNTRQVIKENSYFLNLEVSSTAKHFVSPSSADLLEA